MAKTKKSQVRSTKPRKRKSSGVTEPCLTEKGTLQAIRNELTAAERDVAVKLAASQNAVSTGVISTIKTATAALSGAHAVLERKRVLFYAANAAYIRCLGGTWA